MDERIKICEQKMVVVKRNTYTYRWDQVSWLKLPLHSHF